MKAFYQIRPEADCFLLPSGDVAVCVDWAEKTVQWPVGEVKGWECSRVDLSRASLSTDAAIEKLIRDRISLNDEFALINAYQASVAGIAPDPGKEREYLDFLQWRESMKVQVKESVPAFVAGHPWNPENEPQIPTLNEE